MYKDCPAATCPNGQRACFSRYCPPQALTRQEPAILVGAREPNKVRTSPKREKHSANRTSTQFRRSSQRSRRGPYRPGGRRGDWRHQICLRETAKTTNRFVLILKLIAAGIHLRRVNQSSGYRQAFVRNSATMNTMAPHARWRRVVSGVEPLDFKMCLGFDLAIKCAGGANFGNLNARPRISDVVTMFHFAGRLLLCRGAIAFAGYFFAEVQRSQFFG